MSYIGASFEFNITTIELDELNIEENFLVNFDNFDAEDLNPHDAELILMTVCCDSCEDTETYRTKMDKLCLDYKMVDEFAEHDGWLVNKGEHICEGCQEDQN